MSSNEVGWLTAAELGILFRTRELSPVEVVQSLLARIAALNPCLEAYVTVTADLALAQAQRAEREIAQGIDRGALQGVPYSVKDLFATYGIRTTAGSKILADWIPDEDAAVVARLNQAGAVLLGKVNTHEFPFGVTTRSVHGQTKNPWDLSRIPGGSSGGSAAAVAAGLGPISLGTDTAGSIRIPAALCGVVGLKPTHGRISCYGVVGQSFSVDHIGPITRTVRDAAIVLQAIAGHDSRDPWSSRQPVPDFNAKLGASIRGIRMGVPRELFNLPLEPSVEKAFMAAKLALTEQGAIVKEISIPSLTYAINVSTVIVGAETVVRHEHWLRTRTSDYGDDVRQLLEQAWQSVGPDYIRALTQRQQIRCELEETLTERVDVLLTPAVPIVAPKIGQQAVYLDDKEIDLLLALIHFVCPFSLVGFPSLTIPAGFDDQGLPISIQVVGRPFDEATVLQVGYSFEKYTGHCERHPYMLASGGGK
jgi:aspartyl-tRNA(Asn)/glutamyl-tRNA(Gln) amidotransferase subunit A